MANDMQYINMSGNLPMGIAANASRVRYPAAYSTGAERSMLRWEAKTAVAL